MFMRSPGLRLNSLGDWTKVKFGEKQKLYKVHSYLFMCAGRTFNIEIQESPQGDFLAHADNTADRHDAIKSCQGNNLFECLQLIVKEIESREYP